MFARAQDIPVYLPQAMRPAGSVMEVMSANLRRDVEPIIRFGGVVCEIAEGPAIVCVRDDLPAMSGAYSEQ
ncbi:MAG: hypothetical protein AAB834_05540 [Patescibacteria group bacterium]